MPPEQNELRGTVYAKLNTGECVEIPGLKDVTITEADEALGTIDYVRVIRCKDCKYFLGDGHWCLWWLRVFEDDFCSHGERRKDEEEGV